MPTRAALYCRISKDREGARLGVDRQAAECRELAARNGWTIVATYVDNDLSAYSGKPRPGYRALLEDVRAGRVDVVLCWHTDRLHRSPAELEEYITVCEPRGVPTETVTAGPLDLTTAGGRMVARLHGTVARYEVEHMVERQRSAKRQAAGAGEWLGGRRPYGFEADGVTVRIGEAVELLRMSHAFLAGTGIRRLAIDANKRGLTTSGGGPWRDDAVRRVLLRPRNAGLMEHRGEIVGAAQWPAIVPEQIWRAVVSKLTNPSRRTNLSTARRWLGTGLYACGVCDAKVYGTPARILRGKPTPAVYRCKQGGCVTRGADEVDGYVTFVVLERLKRPDVLELLEQPAGEDSAALAIEAAALRRNLDELAALFGDRTINASQLREGSQRLNEALTDVEARMASAARGDVLAGVAGAEDVEAVWDALPLSRQRAIIDLLVTVTLAPSPKGRPAGWKPGTTYFRPETVIVKGR